MADGLTVKTNRELAEICQVDSRRIYKWRKQGAPQSKDLTEWHGWLAKNRKTAIAGRVSGRIAALTAATAPAPTKPAREEQSDLFGDLSAASEESIARAESIAKAQRMQDQARSARLDRLERERQLLPIKLFQRFAEASPAFVIGALENSVWRSLAPLLDGVDPALRKKLRLAHDQAVLDVRNLLARDHERFLSELLEGLE